MSMIRQVVRTTRGVGRAIKDVNRLREILQVLAHHGFGHLVGSVMLSGAIAYQAGMMEGVREPFLTRTRRSLSLFLSSAADLFTSVLSFLGIWKKRGRHHEQVEMKVRARRVLVDLGPTFVKLGQILSTRPDLVPPDWCEEFSTLQDRVNPLPLRVIEKEIASEFGKPPSEVFASIEPEPLASASIAQVHRATLHDGTPVVIKVRRPNVRARINTDLEILLFLARSVEAQVPQARMVDMPGVLGELRKSVVAETDFAIEADNLMRIRDNFQDFEGIHVPRVYGEVSTSGVLTMEYLDGFPIRDARAAGLDMKRLGQTYMRAAFKMLFEDGFFHGDLHPGNVLVLKNNDLGLLDFGMVGRLSDDHKDQIVTLVLALQRRDFRTIARTFYDLGIKEEPVNYAQFEHEVMEMMDRLFVGRAMADIQIGTFLRELATGCMRFKIRMPPAFTMLLKALVTTEGLAKTLIPEVDPLTEMAPYIRMLAHRRYSSERLQQDLLGKYVAFSAVLDRMPALAAQVMDDYQAGRLTVPVVMKTDRAELEQRERSVNRVILGLIVVGLVLASSIALLDESLRILGIPLLPIFGFSLAFSTWCILLYGIWRSGRI